MSLNNQIAEAKEAAINAALDGLAYRLRRAAVEWANEQSHPYEALVINGKGRSTVVQIEPLTLAVRVDAERITPLTGDMPRVILDN